MGQTIIDEETKIESQTWSAPANFELPTQFEDILTDELTDEKDIELINNQKDTNLIQEKEQSNYVPPTPGEYLANHPLKGGSDFLGNVVKDTAQHSYNSLLDNLLQPNTLLGAEQLDPDNSSPETHPQFYDKKFVTDKDGNLMPIEGIKDSNTPTDLKKELDPQTSTIYQTEFVGPIRPTVGIDGKFNRNLISIAGKNGILGEWGKARTANKDGVWEDYNFLFSDQPLDYDEGMLSKMTSWLLVYGLISRGGKGTKLDFMGWKRPRALTKLGKQVGGLKGLKLNLRGRGYRALTEGQATSILVNEVLGTPGDTGFGGFVSDAVVSMGDQAGIDVRSPITDFLGSENTANDPYHVAKLKNRLAELFVENQVGGLLPEGVGLSKNQLLKAPALAKTFGKGFNTQLEKVTDFAADLIVQQKAVSDLEKAVVLAKDGPTKIKTEVIPTERITGSKNAEPSGKKIEPKATQEELDIQVKEAEVEVVKAEENVEKSVETLGQRDGLIKKALQGELKKVAESDARALKETDAVLKQTRKGRKKIEPGTPHSTKPNIVRSREGRWVTKAYYDKVNKALAGAEEIKKSVEQKAVTKKDSEPSPKINADKKKLEFLGNERKKLQAKATDLLSTERTTKPTIEEAKTLIKDIDNYLDESDKEIFSLVENSLHRNNLEIDYKRIDNFRRQVKNTLKELESRLTNEIGTKPETVESPLTERPFFDFDIKGAKTSYRQMTVEFESDVDRAIYIVTKRRTGRGPARERPLYIEQSNKDASRANHKYLAFLYENGLDDKDILKHAPKIYNKMADNYNEFGTYSLKDSGAWKDGSDFDFEIDESEFYNPERKLGDIIKDVDDKLTDEYKARTSPKDPGDAFDPNNFIDDEIIFEAPKLPILPKKGIKGKAYEPILKSRTNAILNRALEEGISPAGWNNILNDIERIAGIKIQMAGSDSNFILRPKASRGPISARAAANYGIEPGTIVTRRGGYNPKKDLIIMSMMVDGEYLEFSRGLQTAWHESFHRLQYKFLSKAEKEMLKKAAPKLREIVKDGFPEVSDAFINKLKDHELQAWAFGAWSNKDIRSKYGRDTTWSQPFKKIREILESVIAVVRSEHKTWDSLFEGARKGEIAQRQALEVQANARRMSYEIDPDELVSGMGKYQKGIENGDITLDTAMESETRRLISRSGKTDFVSRDNTSLIAMNATMEDAIRGAFGSREEVTNMPAYQLREVWNKASKQVEADGYDPAKTIELYEHARKGDIQAMEDIFAAAGILYHRDLNLKLMTEAAVGFNGADTDKGAALFGKKLLARMEDQIKLDIAWTSVTRKTGQILRLAATPHEDVLASSLASGVELKTTISKEAATAATSGGFAPQQGLIGEGVYFSTSSTPGPIGSVELYGTTPEDILILDLVSTNKRITDLINEIGLGVTKKTKDGIQLTPQQQAGIKTWAEEKGYGGIRYGTDFTLNPKTGDQVVVFDVNTANRMIDSDAAVPPPKKEAPPIRTLLQTALQKTEEVLGKKLPRKVRKSIESGNLTPEAKKILDTLAAITYSIKDDAGAKRAMSDLIERVPDGQLNSSTIANIYRNSLFLRMRTWMKVLFGSGYRAAALPITQIVGEFGDQVSVKNVYGKTEGLMGNVKDAFMSPAMSPEQLKLSQRRQHLNLMIYPQYMRNIPYALRMMVAAMKHNEVFVNLGRRKYENLSTRSFKERQDQLEFDFEAKTRLTEQPPEGHFMLDENANPVAQGIWQIASTLSGRALGGFDTFMAGVTGPSTEWMRIMEMELFNADVKGFEPGSSKAWDWAANRTDEILKSHFQDVDLANGDIIRNGRLTGKHAKKAMDWVNFTDSVKVKQEEMSYEYAVRQAREEGITDPLKIVERADFLMKEELDQGGQFRQAMQGAINVLPDAVSKAHGSENPFIANTVGIAIPIMRTPANLTKSVIRTIPVANRAVDSFWRDVHSEDFNTRSRALGESGVAYMTLAFGVMIVNSGYVEVTGPPPLSTARRKELAEKGWQAWSIRFKNPWAGDTEDEWSPYYSIEMFDQLATVLGAVGAYTENYKGLREEDRESLFGAGMIALRQTAQEIGIGQLIKGPTKSLTDLMDLITELGSTERTKAGSRHPFEYYLTNKLAGYWPGFSDESRNAVDPYQKRINPSKLPIPLNVVENVAKTIAAKSAGLSDLIPNRLHPVTGDPIVSYQTPGNQGIDKDMPWLKMLNANMPWGVTKTRSLSTDPVDEEMLRVKGRGGTFQIWSRRAFGLPDRVLDQNELNRLIEIGTKEITIHGLTLHQALKAKINSPIYQSLPYESVSSSISTSRGLSLMKTIRPYVEKAKEAFEIEYDTGVGSLGWEIKDFKAEQATRKYNAERTEAIIQNRNTTSEFNQQVNY